MNVGSVGLKIGLVAEAARDLYVYTGGRTKIWDTCGPEAILLGAGGRMTDMDGKPLAYDRAGSLQPPRHHRLERPAARLRDQRRWRRSSAPRAD